MDDEMTGSYVEGARERYALAEELQKRVTNLEGIDVGRLDRDQVDVKGRV